MKICYNKLQKLMIDNQMKRQDLMRAAEISSSVATKFNKFKSSLLISFFDSSNIPALMFFKYAI